MTWKSEKENKAQKVGQRHRFYEHTATYHRGTNVMASGANIHIDGQLTKKF